MTNPKAKVRPEQGLSDEQRKKLEDEMRNNQAIGKRASVAANLLPSIIRSYPNLTEEEMVAKAVKLSELVMKDLLGISFAPTE
jgi:hypothetical protein